MTTSQTTGGNSIVSRECGRYVRFSIRSDRLRVYLLPAGRRELREARAENRRRLANGKPLLGDYNLFLDLIEDFLGNGWTVVRPEQVGDLRDDYWLVISCDYAYADENSDDHMLVGTAYSYRQYALESYVDPLVRSGYIDFDRHDYLDSWEFDAVLAEVRPDLFDSETERLRVLANGERRREVQLWEAAGQLRLPLDGFEEAA